MNRESLLEAIFGIIAGLLIVVIAAFRSKKVPTKGVARRSAMLALLTYAIVVVPVLTPSGMTIVGVLALLVVVALALGGSVLARRYTITPVVPAQRYVHALVGTGVAAVLLIATGQTLALVGRVDPRMMVVVVAVIAAMLVAGQGLVASSRISSLAMWLLIVPILIALALGFLLGNITVVASPIRLADGAPYAAIMGAAVSVFALGWADNTLAMSSRFARWSPIRVLGGVFVVVLLICLGLLAFLGGAIFAPSMEFFVVPSNIDALPGLAGLLLAVLTVLFAALVANALTGVGALGVDPPEESPAIAFEPDSKVADSEASKTSLTVAAPWVMLGALVAVIIALLDPGAQQVLVATGLAAAAVMGAQLSRGNQSVGSIAGVIAGVIATIVLVFAGQMTLGWGSMIATLVTLSVAFVAGRMRR